MKQIAATVLGVLLAAAEPALAMDRDFDERDCTKTETQQALNRCAAENLDAANRALTDVYRDVLKLQDTESSRRALRYEQRTWVSFKDKKCAGAAGPREEGGSMWPTNWAYCELEATKKRIHELKAMTRAN